MSGTLVPQLEAPAETGSPVPTCDNERTCNAVTPPRDPWTLRTGRMVWNFLAKTWHGFGWLVEGLFGLVSLVAFLAFLGSLPILCVLTYGYVLELSGRIARTGRLSAGWIGIRPAARLGGFVLGTYLVLLPLLFSATLFEASKLVPPNVSARNFGIFHAILTVVLGTHLMVAWARGGKWWHFLWPLPSLPATLNAASWLFVQAVYYRGAEFKPALRARAEQVCLHLERPHHFVASAYLHARDQLWDFVTALRLPYFAWLGLRGLAATWIWLLLPTLLLAAGHRLPGIGFLGGILLGMVALYLPFLQVRFAQENQFLQMFNVAEVRRQFQRAPIFFVLALALTLLGALPLYLLYIEYPPEDILWLPEIFFILFLLPAHALTGWAVAWANHRTQPRHWVLRWLCWPLTPVLAATYVVILFFTQYVTQDGRLNLFDQHAFVVPFLNF